MSKQINYQAGKVINGIKLIKDLGMLYPNETSKRKSHYGLFQCPFCGNEFKSVILNVKIGDTKSCGCYQIKRATTHGLTNHRLYRTWKGMKERCYNPNKKDYKYYGGREITICKEWLNDFQSFYNWAIRNGYKPHLTIDRYPDKDGNYAPDNCRWATMKEQNNNRRELKSTNKTGYKNISWHKANNRFVLTIKNKHIGSYKSIEEAILAKSNHLLLK